MLRVNQFRLNSCLATSDVERNLKRRGIISTFFKRIFFGTIILKLIEKQEKLWGVRGHAPRKISGKFTCCNGYFKSAF